MTIVCITRRRSFAAIHTMSLQSAAASLAVTARAPAPRHPSPGRYPERLPSLGLKLTSRTSSRNPAQRPFPQRRWRRWDVTHGGTTPHPLPTRANAPHAKTSDQHNEDETNGMATTKTHKIPRSPDKERGVKRRIAVSVKRGTEKRGNQAFQRSITLSPLYTLSTQ